MKTREVVFHQSDLYEEIECCDHCHGEPGQCPGLKPGSETEWDRWALQDYSGEALALVREFVAGHADFMDLKRFVLRVDALAVVP